MTARKSTTRTTSKAAAGPEPEKTNFDRFSEFRARAAHVDVPDAFDSKIEPYVLGPEQGFDPPVTIDFPSEFEDQVRLDMAFRARDYFQVLSVLTGPHFGRIIHALGQADDSYRLLAGLSLKIVDHFTGRGAADVPGGSSPS